MSAGSARQEVTQRMGAGTTTERSDCPTANRLEGRMKEAQPMADDHDTVVVKDSGSGAGMILGILAVIIVLAGLWYFALGPGSSGGGSTTQENNPDVNIEVPEAPVEPNPS